MLTALQLKAGIIADIWASGEAENLSVAHGNQFQEALADIAKWVPCEQTRNANLVKFCQTNYKMGMTILPAPAGRIYRVFTVANEIFDNPVFYRQTEWPEPENWARNLYLFPSPLTTDARKLPMGFQYSNAANDSLYGRARTGIWSVWRGNIYLAPWTQSNEMVVIEWDGIKTTWADGDPVSAAIKYRQAVKLFMQFAHERDFGTVERADRFKNRQHSGWYDEALEDLMHECREQTKLRDTPGYDNRHERDRLCSELTMDLVIPDAEGVTIADLGNIGQPGVDLSNISALVHSWGPDAIMASGIIGGATTDYDLTAGANFFDAISPYIGNKGIGAESNSFWPVPSVADWAKDSLATLQRFFPIPNNGRYYTLALGDVQLFVIDSSNDVDGNTAGSVQGLWLQAQLALSTAPWKIVKMELSPYGSVHNNAVLQWPFAAWGAHLVISSQSINYERLLVGGLPYINNGLGGFGTIEEVAIPAAGLQFANAAGFGAGKITATALSLVYQFYGEDGTLLDTLSLTK